MYSQTVPALISKNVGNTLTNFKNWGGIIFNPMAYDAEGNGETDDTVAVQAAINAAYAAGGGTVIIHKPYRITAQLSMKSNVNLWGFGAGELYMDFTGTRGILGLGTISAEVTVTANVSEGDIAVTVGNTASPVAFAVGDLVRIVDIHPNGTRYPANFGIVKSLTATTITLQSPITIPYLTSNTTTISKLTPIHNVAVEGLTITASDSSDIEFMLGFQYAKDIQIRNNIIKNHRSISNPGLLISYWTNNVYNLFIESNTKYGVGDVTLDAGDSFSIFQGDKTKIVNNTSIGGAVGISAWMSIGTIIEGNHIQGIRQNGHRGIKVAGSYYTKVVDNTIQSTDSGIKHEDSSRSIITGNHILDCGFDSSSTGINCSSQYSGDGEYVDVMIKGNYVKRQNGNGIYLDNYINYCQVEGNFVTNVTGKGIITGAFYSQVIGNQVREFVGTGIQFNPYQAIVKENHVYAAATSQKSYGMSSGDGTGAIFSDNSAPNNALDTTYDVTALGFFGNNYIGGAITKYIDRTNRGKATVVISGTSFGAANVTFADPYPAGMIPLVVATCDQGSYYAVISAANETGFTALALHRDGTAGTINVGVNWIAVKP